MRYPADGWRRTGVEMSSTVNCIVLHILYIYPARAPAVKLMEMSTPRHKFSVNPEVM